MKFRLLTILALVGLGQTLAAEREPIAAKVGQEFEIKLESNPSTGFQWLLAKPLDAKLLKHLGTVYKRPTSRLVGAAGTEILTFKALGEGKSEINLKYGRLWEASAGSTVKTNFAVVITKGDPTRRN